MTKIQVKSLPIVLLSLTLFLTGCIHPWWWIETTVTTPPLPTYLTGWRGFSWRLEWCDGYSSGVRERAVDDPTVSMVVSLPVPPGRSGSVVITAVLSLESPEGETIRLFPAGGTFPTGVGGVLSWEGGSVAALLCDLAKRGIPPDLVNVDRLYSEAAWRVGENQWLLDREAVGAALAEHRMRASLVRPVETVPVTVPVPEGTFFSENVLLPPQSAAAVGVGYEIYLKVVPGQRCRWWSLDGGISISVWCDDAGRCNRHVRTGRAALTSRRY